jgi:ankyrin repeat protein
MLVVPLLAIFGVAFLFLLYARASVADQGTDTKLVGQLIDLAVQDQAAALRLLREHPELLKARYLHDETPLHFCAVEGLTEGVRFFAGAGMPVDAPNAFGDTALMDAATLGNLEVVKLLLRHGADPNATSRTRESVLHDAVRHGHVEVAAALLGAGARADYVTSLGGTIWDAVASAPSRRDELLGLLDRHRIRR